MTTDASDIKAAVFDLGGTLLDFAKPESLTTLRMGFRSGYDHLTERRPAMPPFARYRRTLESRMLLAYLWSRLTGGELDPMVELNAAHRRLDIDLDEGSLADLAKAVYAPTKAIARAAPGSASTLAELARRGYKLAVVSNTVAPPPGLDDHLDAEGLLEFFPIRVYSCVVGVPKPNPRIFTEALNQLNVPANQAVYIGDKPRIDVKGARRVGMMTVLRVPPSQPVPSGPRPDHLIRDIPELLDLLGPRPTS